MGYIRPPINQAGQRWSSSKETNIPSIQGVGPHLSSWGGGGSPPHTHTAWVERKLLWALVSNSVINLPRKDIPDHIPDVFAVHVSFDPDDGQGWCLD